ncbi:hypothetical protein D915_008481 [Fasciola hepatica]|uniref:Uncharacterized protein n=1 Tax=Fasciola hepatica TaxID=6192 RepID=A0A4E0R0G7_FASHE|nr:hypothetical protein D915_008481 [Fasciola hepatica]
MPTVMFYGIHSATFHIVSNFRIRMSADLYIDRFLPALAKELRNQTGVAAIRTQMIYEALILPMFDSHPQWTYALRGSVLVDFTSVNRGYFSKRMKMPRTNSLSDRNSDNTGEDNKTAPTADDQTEC